MTRWVGTEGERGGGGGGCIGLMWAKQWVAGLERHYFISPSRLDLQQLLQHQPAAAPFYSRTHASPITPVNNLLLTHLPTQAPPVPRCRPPTHPRNTHTHRHLM